MSGVTGEAEAAARVVPGGRDATDVVHADLRRRILSGAVPAGAVLSQARIAADYAVSRAPVREAFRLLQREGLIETEVNQRARVTRLSLDEVEHLYVLRITAETLALRVSVPHFTEAELAELDGLVAAIEAAQARGFEVWEETHQRFHLGLVAHCGPGMLAAVRQWQEHTGRYRRVYVGSEDSGWTTGAREHAELVRLCRHRDAAGAVALLARHLARAALALIASMDPGHEPALLRAAIRGAVPSGGGAR